MSSNAGRTNATNWIFSPRRDRSREVSYRISATTPKNRMMQMNICTNFSPEDNGLSRGDGRLGRQDR